MKDYFKLLIKYIMRFFLKVYWLFPIRKKTIFFMANMGKGFLCNPKYIYKSIIEDGRFDEYHFVWCFVDPSSQDNNQFNQSTRIIRRNNLFRFFYYLLTSEVIVYNCGGFSYAPIRKKQFLIETGHGGGLQKKNGFMVESKSVASNKGIALADRDIKLWLASDEMHGKVYIRKAMGYKGEILKSGYPRSDIFFTYTEEEVANIKSKLGVKENQHIILYAPTFKGSESNASTFSDGAEIIDIKLVKECLHNRFGGEWVFATRGHQYSQSVPLLEVDFNWTSYSDMQELLLVTDVLITDYSSCVWDFFVLRRPSFLYVPDREYYERKDRGFYIPLEQWPGMIVANNAEWERIISTYDKKAYGLKLDNFGKMMNSYEKGNACEVVKDRILKEIER